MVITCLVHGYHVLVTRLQSGNNAVSWKEGVEFSAPFFFIRSERCYVKYQVKIMYTPFLGVFFWLIFALQKRTFNGFKCYPSGRSLTLWEAPLRGLGTTIPMITPLDAL